MSIAWMLGVTAMLANLIRQWIHLRRRLSRLTPIECGRVQERLIEHCRRMGIKGPPELRGCHVASTPFLVGFWRPVIALPILFSESVSNDELDAVITHELAHVQRRDLLWNWLPVLAEAAFFFHPLVWWSRREWQLAQEVATDELAITSSGLEISRYARALVDLVAKSTRPRTDSHFIVAVSENYTQLARRLAALRVFSPEKPGLSAIAGVIVAFAVAFFAPWELAAQQEQTESSQGGELVPDVVVGGALEIEKPLEPDANQMPAMHPISVSGRALDVDGNPISSATMYLSSQRVDYRRLAEVVTDATGRYEFHNVPLPLETDSPFSSRTSGRFEVFGIAAGYGFGWRPAKWYYPARYAEVAHVNWEETDPPEHFFENEPINLDVTFREEARLSGSIYDDDGQPISNASVAIRYCDPELDLKEWNSIRGGRQFDSLNEKEIVPPKAKTRYTDAKGRFEFTGLPADCRYRIDVRPKGFPARWIWGVTKKDFAAEANGRPIYRDEMTLEFVRPKVVSLRVVFEDTGLPAQNVRVGAANAQGSSSRASDKDGNVKLPLSAGEYSVELLPAIGTPYLVTNRKLVVPSDKSLSSVELRLRRAAVVDVQVIDEASGEGIADVDFWSDDASVDRRRGESRRLHYFRSYERETRICHVERPRTDADGTLRALFEPGEYQVGIGLNLFPYADYINVDADGTLVELRSGEATKVTLKVRRRAPSLQESSP
ncbi:MAG: M56 family metallopeptidase [Rubripirellula sp.]